MLILAHSDKAPSLLDVLVLCYLSKTGVPASANSLLLGVKRTIVSWEVFCYTGKAKVVKDA